MTPLDRRSFLQFGAAVSLVAAGAPALPAAPPPSGRPAPGLRKFSSPAVEATIQEVKAACHPELGRLFENCFPNTLDTTVFHKVLNGQPDTFVITGDIHAMWLRDSTAQVWPYLPLMARDPKLQALVAGLIHRQSACIRIDPYANAFNDGPGVSHWATDHTDMKPELHERKWEVDSLCWPIRLAHGYVTATGDASVLDSDWRTAMRLVLRTFREQQRKEDPGPYRFERTTPWQHDTQAQGGWGNPWKPCGLIASAFRPSDDATVFLFLVPSNHFAVASLRQMATLAEGPGKDPALAREARALADEVEAALRRHALVQHPKYGRIWAFEVDGFGNALQMDDANAPSLLTLPYLGCCAAKDPVYQATRRFVLSDDNPYFIRGRVGSGISSPHAKRHRIWHLALIGQAITATSDAEIRACLRTLMATHDGTYFMHEAFGKDDPRDYTRKWFAWANTFFGELILKLHRERPHLLKEA